MVFAVQLFALVPKLRAHCKVSQQGREVSESSGGGFPVQHKEVASVSLVVGIPSTMDVL